MEPLKLKTDSLDGLPEAVAALYSKHDDGDFHLNVDSDNEALMRALKSERSMRKEAEHVAATVPEKDAALTAAAAERDRAVAATEKMKTMVFNVMVRAAATGAGIHDKAHGDAMRAVRELFVLGDDGEVKPRDESSKLTLPEFFVAAQQESPHWFPATASGSGAMQTSSQGAVNRTISRRAFDALRPAQQSALMREGATKLVD